MPSVCHSVVRAEVARVTRLGPCGEILDTACAFAVTSGFVDITLTKVFQERQDALQLNANGDICVDKPKAPNDATTPEAIGWCTLPDSAASSNFALEFWTGTEDEGCDDESVTYGYGLLPRVVQGSIGDVTIANGVINFTVTAITRPGNQWGVGPYNVIINETGLNAGLPGPLLTAVNTQSHKCFMWTLMPPPAAACGCQDLTPLLTVAPLAGSDPLLVTLTFPLDDNGDPILPGVVDWDDGGAEEEVTSGTTVQHTYVAAGTYTPTYRPTGSSSPTYVSADVVVT
jgi:hypothetical protein